jgi:hypothetical protein
MIDLRAFVVMSGLVTATAIVWAMVLIGRYHDSRRDVSIQETVSRYQQKFDERFSARLKCHLSGRSEDCLSPLSGPRSQP